MHRSFYSFAILVNVLIAVMVSVEALLYFIIGNRLMYLDQYPSWLLATLFFSLLQGVAMATYFKLKHYTAALWTGIMAYASLLSLIFINYATLTLGFGAIIIIPLYILTLLLQVVYNATVSLSVSKERSWLRIAGLYGALLAITSLGLVAIIASGKFIEYHPTIERYHGFILGADVILSLMLAMNFYHELQHDSIGKAAVQHNIFYYARPLAGIVALYFIVSFGTAGLQMKTQLPGVDEAIRKVAEPFEARVYVNAGSDTLKYRLLRPLDFDPAKSYPIVVSLHGSSGTGNDNYRQVAAALMPEFMTHGSNREKFRAFIFVPQCTFGTSWGGHPLPAIDQIVFETMASLEKEFPIDTNRRYVTGISLGGYGTWHFIASRPDVFAAAIPICGSSDAALAPNCINVPVWAFHGAHDDRVPVSGSRDMIKAMRAAGGDPRYTEFPDAGHDIGRMAVDTPGLLDWLFAQRRGDLPR